MMKQSATNQTAGSKSGSTPADSGGPVVCLGGRRGFVPVAYPKCGHEFTT